MVWFNKISKIFLCVSWVTKLEKQQRSDNWGPLSNHPYITALLYWGIWGCLQLCPHYDEQSVSYIEKTIFPFDFEPNGIPFGACPSLGMTQIYTYIYTYVYISICRTKSIDFIPRMKIFQHSLKQISAFATRLNSDGHFLFAEQIYFMPCTNTNMFHRSISSDYLYTDLGRFTPGRLAPGWFTPQKVHSPDSSPPGQFTPRTCSPPGLFTPRNVHPLEFFTPWIIIITSDLSV